MTERKNRTSNTSFVCHIIKEEKFIFISIKDNSKSTTQGLHI